MQTRGVIGHYLFVSAKTNAGVEELRTALFDCDIDNGNKELEPSIKMDPIKKVSKTRRRIERKKLNKKMQALKNNAPMAQTFTAGFVAETANKLDLGDDEDRSQ